jgi:hypothetical protein
MVLGTDSISHTAADTMVQNEQRWFDLRMFVEVIIDSIGIAK